MEVEDPDAEESQDLMEVDDPDAWMKVDDPMENMWMTALREEDEEQAEDQPTVDMEGILLYRIMVRTTTQTTVTYTREEGWIIESERTFEENSEIITHQGE
jgi:hypothetical protein